MLVLFISSIFFSQTQHTNHIFGYIRKWFRISHLCNSPVNKSYTLHIYPMLMCSQWQICTYFPFFPAISFRQFVYYLPILLKLLEIHALNIHFYSKKKQKQMLNAINKWFLDTYSTYSVPRDLLLLYGLCSASRSVSTLAVEGTTKDCLTLKMCSCRRKSAINIFDNFTTSTYTIASLHIHIHQLLAMWIL